MRFCTLALTLLAWSAGCRGNFDAQPDATSIDAETTTVGCELLLHMDEASWGTSPVVDSCGGDDHGVALGGASIELDAERGRVGFFGGLASVLVADSPRLRGAGGLTVSAWVKPLAPVGTPPAGIVAKRTSYGVKSAYTMFLWTNAHLWTDVALEDDRIEVPAAVLADRWTHLTLVYDGDSPRPKRVRTYQDGLPSGQWTESSAQIPDDYDAPVIIGHLPDAQDPNLYFHGRLDDVAIWSRPLSDEEVARWHQLTKR